MRPKPWFAIFLPNRVYLKKIQSDQANITWRFRGEQAGFFGTQLLITPNGRDFDYVATGGRLKMAVAPRSLPSPHTPPDHERFDSLDLDLASDSHARKHSRSGHAGLGQDKSIDVKATFTQCPLPWLLSMESAGSPRSGDITDLTIRKSTAGCFGCEL